MEAIFLACGAGGPQLKRNPLGSSMRSLASCCVTVALWTCATSQAPSPITAGREATIGCYRLTFGPWSNGSSVPDSVLAITIHALPQTVHLHATGEVTPRYQAFGQPPTSVRGTWTLFGTDSLAIQWAGQTLTLLLHPYPDSLAGNATLGFDEAIGPITWPSATVVARPVQCSKAAA